MKYNLWNMLTSIMNAQKSGKSVIQVPNQKLLLSFLNVLWDEGYISVGDWHSTRPLEAGMTEEETRFGGLKRECGLHELSGQQDWQI